MLLHDVIEDRAGVGVRPGRRSNTPGRGERSDRAGVDRQREPSRLRLAPPAFRMPSRRANALNLTVADRQRERCRGAAVAPRVQECLGDVRRADAMTDGV